MSNEPIFVAVGITCVIAVLLFIVFIIYCVKRQQDKEQTRLLRQRRAREERHRRHLMGGNIVRPPAYDPNRQNLIPNGEHQIPISPPPEYKEVATPLPRNRGALGFEDIMYPLHFSGYLSESGNIHTLSRNIAPVHTTLSRHSYWNTLSYVPSSNYNGNTNNNRTTTTTTISDNSLQVPPSQVAEVDPVSRYRKGDPVSHDLLQPRNSRQIYSTSQELDVTALIRQYSIDRAQAVNSVSLTNGSQRSSLASHENTEDTRQFFNQQVDSRQPYTWQGTSVREIASLGGSGSVDSSKSTPPAPSYSSARAPGHILDSNIVDMSPIQTSNSPNQSGTDYPRHSTNQAERNHQLISGFEDLALI